MPNHTAGGMAACVSGRKEIQAMKIYLPPLAELFCCADDDLIRTSGGLELWPDGSDPDMEGNW